MNRPPLTEEQRALVDQNTAIVEEQVSLMRSRIPSNSDLAELYSSASLGLVFAAQDHDPKKGTFQSYARLRVRGEMLDAIRNLDWCSRRDRARIKRLTAMREKLAQAAGREIDQIEACSHLARTADDHRRYTFAAGLLAPISLDLLVGDSEDNSLGNVIVADESIRSAPDEMERREQLAALVVEMERLPEIERKVLAFYYYEKLRMREIGEALGFTESRVCQILQKARSTLRRRLNAHHYEQRKIQAVAPVLPFSCGRPSNKRNRKVALGTMRGGTRRHGRTFRSTDNRLDGCSMDARGDDSLAGIPRVDAPPNPGSAGAWCGDGPTADAMRPDMPRDSAWWHDFRALVIELEVQKAHVRAKDREITRLNNLLSPRPREAEIIPFVRSSRGASLMGVVVACALIAGAVLLSGCGTLGRGRIKVPGGSLLSGPTTVKGVADAGTAPAVNTSAEEKTLKIPAGSTITETKTEAVPATETTPAKPAFQVREIKLSADSAWIERAQQIQATAGTIDTSVAKHKADVESRMPLLWGAIACAVGALVVKSMLPLWPSIANGLFIGAGLLFGSWKFSEVPWWGALIAIGAVALLALGYKRGEWDKNGDGVPDILQRKPTSQPDRSGSLRLG